MSLRFILGSRLSGKTSQIYGDILSARADSNSIIYLITPEQVTFNHEHEFDLFRAKTPMPDFHIRSFSRLTRDVLSISGGLSQDYIDELGYKFILYKVLDDIKDDLVAYGNSYSNEGFYDEVMAIMAEVDSNMLSSHDLSVISEKLVNVDGIGDLAKKLQDLARIKAAVNAYKGDNSIDHNSMMTLFINAISGSDLIKNSIFFIDDFYDFTNQEYQIIGELMKVAASVEVSLMINKNALNPNYDGAFNKSYAAYERLMKLAQDNGCPILDEVYPNFDMSVIPADIKYLRDNYFIYPTKSYQGNVNAVCLMEGQGRKSEVEGVAREIGKLIGQGHYSINDINIAVRDINGYSDTLKEVMALYNIPISIDEKIELSNHPLFIYLASFINVFQNNFKYDDVIDLIKSPFFPMGIGDTDLFENYSLAHGIKGKKFYQDDDFSYNDDDVSLEYINQIRRSFKEFILPYKKSMTRNNTPKLYCKAIYEFMINSHVPDILQKYSDDLGLLGESLESQVFGNIWDKFIYMLDQIVVGLEDEKMPIKQFNLLITMSMKEIDLGIIPKGLGVIQVSALGHSRVPVKKVSFILGVNEGKFPEIPSDDSLISMRERDVLINTGVLWELDRTYHWDNESLLIYLAITSATDKLYLSYTSGLDGDEKSAPSMIIKRVESLLPGIAKFYPIDFPMIPNEFTVDMALSHEKLFTLLPFIKKHNKSLYNKAIDYYKELPSYTHRVNKLVAATIYSNQFRNLDKSINRQLFGDRLKLSISSLESYNKCPFSYFAKYGLRLQERKEYIFKAPDMGNFFHYALESLMNRMDELGIHFKELTDYKDELIEWVVADTAPKIANEILFSDEKMAFIKERLVETLSLTIDIMIAQVREGDVFAPIRWEVSFGPNGELSSQSFSMKLDDDRELVLVGKIDRIDGVKDGDNFYFRVIDYKSSNMTLALDDIYYGHKLQLLLYLMVARENVKEFSSDNPVAAGAFYFATKEFYVNVDNPISVEEANNKILREGKLDGYIIGKDDVAALLGQSVGRKSLEKKDMELLFNHLSRIIKQCGEKIIMGDFPVSPSYHRKNSSCTYCNFSVVCGFDPLLPHNKERYLPKIDDNGIVRKLGGDDDESN